MAKGFLSCSPAGRGCRGKVKAGQYIEGYGIGRELLGWCIVADMKLFDMIGNLDEGCEFWYSDNLYAEQLKHSGIRHCVVGGRLVDHVESVTLRTKTQAEQHRMTQLQRRVFDELRKKYT
jgi:hypothetical protein